MSSFELVANSSNGIELMPRNDSPDHISLIEFKVYSTYHFKLLIERHHYTSVTVLETFVSQNDWREQKIFQGVPSLKVYMYESSFKFESDIRSTGIFISRLHGPNLNEFGVFYFDRVFEAVKHKETEFWNNIEALSPQKNK